MANPVFNPGTSKKLFREMLKNTTFTSLDPVNRYAVEIIDNAYKNQPIKALLDTANSKNGNTTIKLDLRKSFNWYDITVRVTGNNLFEKRYAGHVETGNESMSDPQWEWWYSKIDPRRFFKNRRRLAA